MQARHLLFLVGVVLAYFVTGRIGLALASVHPSATAVWAPSGIAIAAVLLMGPIAAVPVGLAAFAVNFSTSGALPSSLLIATGNTLEALVAWQLLRRWGGPASIDTTRGIVAFVALAAGVASLVSASIGVGSLVITGLATAAAAPPIWLTWWFGDATGALLVAPPLLLWARTRHTRPTPREVRAALALVLAYGATALFVFGPFKPGGLSSTPIAFLVVPVVIWAAFRHTPRTVTTATAGLAVAATLGTLAGYGPFANLDGPAGNLLMLQIFAGTLGVSALLVATVVTERRAIERTLMGGASELEARVREGEHSISENVQALQREVEERRRTQRRLAESERRLEAAVDIAGLGSWEWDLVQDRIQLTDHACRMMGLAAAAEDTDPSTFLAAIAEEDRASTEAILRRAIEERTTYDIEHRVVDESGDVRTLRGRGMVITNDAGEPQKLVGTLLDATDEKRAFAALKSATVTRTLVRRLLTGLIHADDVPPRAVRELGTRLAAELPAEGLDAAVEHFHEIGLGHLKVVRREGKVTTIEGDDLIERVARATQPTCLMTLSFLEAMVARESGRASLGTETHCQSRGHARCIFVVRAG